MTCFRPLQGYQSAELTDNGKRRFTYNSRKAFRGHDGNPVHMDLPCNRCSGCRVTYSREWAIRCMHEASLYDNGLNNSFITLTYNDKFIPKIFSDDGRILGEGTLNYDHWTLFMKRLRKALEPLKIRFYMGPEYGDENLRPHFHALIFGYDFPDKELYTVRNGHRLYRSKLLEDTWSDPDTGESYGYSTVGSCTFQSAAYVARYMMKKVKGEDVDGRYQRFNLETGECFQVEPEKARMSNRNGIGKEWFDKYGIDTYCSEKDFITMGDGRKVRPPKYYDRIYEKISPEEFLAIKESRTQMMAITAGDRTRERLEDREKCFLASIKKLPRTLKKESFE